MTAIVHLDPDACPDCGATFDGHTWDQPALFIHGGYDATTRTVLRKCGRCGWALIAERGEVRP